MEKDRENERKGNGIFLGIVGVATLIVAIIGASFAYFSAQAASAENAVNLTAYEFNASLSMQEIEPSDAKLIPVDPVGTVEGATSPNNTNLAYSLNVADHKCVDSQGYKICALYEISITNGSSTEITLQGSVVTNVNEASTREDADVFTNLQYRPVTFNEGKYTIGGTAVALKSTVGESANIGTITVPANDTVVTYAVIYLNENENQSAEMGAHYEGKIVYASTNGNGNRLTGTFIVG